MAVIQPPAQVLDDREYAQGHHVTADTHREIVLGGKSYRWDLTEANAAEFDKHLGEWLGFAQQVPARGHRKSRQQTGTADRERNQAIREWARSQGIQVSDRGRINSETIEAYDRAH